jgi:hypothetical protein
MAEPPPQVHGSCQLQLVRATKRASGNGLARVAASAAALVAGAVAVAVLVSMPQRPRSVAETGAALFSSVAPASACCEGCMGAPVQGMQGGAMAVRLNLSDAARASTTCSSSEAAGRLCECLVVGVPGSARSLPASEVAEMSAVHRRAHVISGLYQGGRCSLPQCLAASDSALATLCLPCAPGYLQVLGDIGEKHLPVVTVKSCTDCARLCDGIGGCVAYSCSKTEMECRLDSKTVPGLAANKDLAVCSKEASLTLPQPAGRRLLGECDCSKCARASIQDLQDNPPGFAGAREHQAQEKREEREESMEREARVERKEREVQENEDKLRHALEQREERNEREERREEREERERREVREARAQAQPRVSDGTQSQAGDDTDKLTKLQVEAAREKSVSQANMLRSEARAAARLQQSAKTLENERKVSEKQKPQREAEAIAREAAELEVKARKAIAAAAAAKERKDMLRMQAEVLRNSKEWNQEISQEGYAMGAHPAHAHQPRELAVQNRPLLLSETGCVDELTWVDPLSGAKCSDWKGYGCEDSWEGSSLFLPAPSLTPSSLPHLSSVSGQYDCSRRRCVYPGEYVVRVCVCAHVSA